MTVHSDLSEGINWERLARAEAIRCAYEGGSANHQTGLSGHDDSSLASKEIDRALQSPLAAVNSQTTELNKSQLTRPAPEREAGARRKNVLRPLYSQGAVGTQPHRQGES